MFLNNDISQLIADSDRMSFYLYDSSFWKELVRHQAGCNLFKIGDSVYFFINLSILICSIC